MVPGLVSVVIPVYNEAESVRLLYEELAGMSRAWGRPCEFVFVNDGSRDASPAVLDQLAVRDPQVTIVHLRRNFGQTAAMVAGIDHARGDIILSLIHI